MGSRTLARRKGDEIMRVPVPKGRTLAGAILGFANGVAAVCDWLEDVEDGAEPIRAAKKAYRKAVRRGAAMKKIEVKNQSGPARRIDGGGGGVVIDVTPEVERRRASR
jgi:hypothetical protein